MLEAITTIQKPIDDEFRNLLSLNKLKADWDVREWYENAVKEYGKYMKPYLQVMLYLLRCQVKKHRKLLEEYASERWNVVTNEEHKKLFDSMRELEDKMKIDRRISSYVWRDENQKKFMSDSEMYNIKSLEEFKKMQKNKLKISERVMTLFEIEHTQQIVEHTRNEFQRLERIEAERYGDTMRNYLRLEKRAKMIKEEIKMKSDMNCNLHYRMITLRNMFKDIINQLFGLFNYYLDEKKCTNVERFSKFDLQMFSEILGAKPRECIENKRDFCVKDFLDLILVSPNDECDKKKNLQITENNLKFGRIIDEGSDHEKIVEEIIDNVLENVIRPQASKSVPSISFSHETDYLEKLKDDEILVEEAIEDQRDDEIYYRLVGDELKILRDIEPETFIKQRLDIIFDTIRKNKELIAPIFERF
ncbi:hypothetical protein O3M35_012469 [Rhynocoris fuscipes]|uniref:Uncharacterized protein n=1 Tax=Rhynocoris fuscipes TaxID=488301 RepID=A0AAW1CU25_9HEMI